MKCNFVIRTSKHNYVLYIPHTHGFMIAYEYNDYTESVDMQFSKITCTEVTISYVDFKWSFKCIYHQDNNLALFSDIVTFQ